MPRSENNNCIKKKYDGMKGSSSFHTQTQNHDIYYVEIPEMYNCLSTKNNEHVTEQ